MEEALLVSTVPGICIIYWAGKENNKVLVWCTIKLHAMYLDFNISLMKWDLVNLLLYVHCT